MSSTVTRQIPGLVIDYAGAQNDADLIPFADDVGGFQVQYDGTGLPDIDDNDQRSLCELLIQYASTYRMSEDEYYWTDQQLRHLITPARYAAEFEKLPSQQPPMSFDELKKGYIRIFALLVLCERVNKLADFKREGVDDKALPLVPCEATRSLSRLSAKKTPLKCVESFSWPQRDHFLRLQKAVMIPFFGLGEGGTCKEHRLRGRCIRPWRRYNGSEEADDYGAYARVRRVEIHPTAHGFHDLLRKLHLHSDVFAIKTLRRTRDQGQVEFQKELKHLQHFNNHRNKHLIVALAAFECDGEWNFVFPSAVHDLSRHMENNPPQNTLELMKWAAEQIYGLTSALADIHSSVYLEVPRESRREPGLARKIYGRHGDIKCDNILCFASTNSTNMTLVISDFGLSETHGEHSKSNIPNHLIPPVPGYRPPECDIKSGTVSRAFDVWTLGCLYLDFLTWLLGGPGLALEFRQKRIKQYITGANQDIFFEFQKQKDPEGFVIRVKPEVMDWIWNLRRHPKCSQMVQEMLNIIERQMLVVLSQIRLRSPSAELRNQFQKIHHASVGDDDYCVGPAKISADGPVSPEVVEAQPNDEAQRWIDTKAASLKEHRGPVSMGLTPQQHEDPTL